MGNVVVPIRSKRGRSGILYGTAGLGSQDQRAERASWVS